MPTAEDHEEALQALHVIVDNTETEKAAEWGSWTTFVIAASTVFPAQQILPQNDRRKSANIWVTGAAGYVLVGTRGQVMNGQGGRLTAGSANRFEVSNSQELWMTNDGVNAVTVTVLDERYE